MSPDLFPQCVSVLKVVDEDDETKQWDDEDEKDVDGYVNDDDADDDLALIDTLSDSIQCLNFAKNWFNSIFDSILVSQNSIQTIIQFKIICGDSIQ